MPQEPLGGLQIACLERRAYRGTRYPLALEQHVGHRLEMKAMTQRGVLQRRKIAAAPLAEAKVAPYQQPAHTEAAHQHLLDKARRAARGKARIEARDVH